MDNSFIISSSSKVNPLVCLPRVMMRRSEDILLKAPSLPSYSELWGWIFGSKVFSTGFHCILVRSVVAGFSCLSASAVGEHVGEVGVGGRGIDGGGESGGPKSADLFNRSLVGDEGGSPSEPEGILRIPALADAGASLGKESTLD